MYRKSLYRPLKFEKTAQKKQKKRKRKEKAKINQPRVLPKLSPPREAPRSLCSVRRGRSGTHESLPDPPLFPISTIVVLFCRGPTLPHSRGSDNCPCKGWRGRTQAPRTTGQPGHRGQTLSREAQGLRVVAPFLMPTTRRKKAGELGLKLAWLLSGAVGSSPKECTPSPSSGTGSSATVPVPQGGLVCTADPLPKAPPLPPPPACPSRPSRIQRGARSARAQGRPASPPGLHPDHALSPFPGTPPPPPSSHTAQCLPASAISFRNHL